MSFSPTPSGIGPPNAICHVPFELKRDVPQNRTCCEKTMEKKLGLGILGAARMLDKRGGLGGVDRLEPVIQNHYRQSGMQGSSYPFQKSVHVDICSNLDGGCEKWISVDLAVSSLPISGMCPSRCSSPWKQILTWRPGQKLLGYVGIQWILGDIGGGSKAYEVYWNITYIYNT